MPESQVTASSAPRRFTRLPERVPPELMRTTHDTDPVHEERDDYWREVEWMLRVAGL